MDHISNMIVTSTLISSNWQYGTHSLCISSSDVYNWIDFAKCIHVFTAQLCINGKPFTCAVHLLEQHTAGPWYRRALSAFWKSHHASRFGHSNALIEVADVVFCHSQETCRSELRPSDEHCGTLPSAASRYDPPETHNRSISDNIENLMSSAFLNSILLRQILWLGSERFDLLKKRGWDIIIVPSSKTLNLRQLQRDRLCNKFRVLFYGNITGKYSAAIKKSVPFFCEYCLMVSLRYDPDSSKAHDRCRTTSNIKWVHESSVKLTSAQRNTFSMSEWKLSRLS